MLQKSKKFENNGSSQENEVNINNNFNLFWKLTGGRPMLFEGFAFIDAYTGKPVNYYRDRLGNLWMADNGKWSFYRVQIDKISRNMREDKLQPSAEIKNGFDI